MWDRTRGNPVRVDDVPVTASLAEHIKAEIDHGGWRRVLLLGTPEQMSDPMLRRPLAASGILLLVPGAADRAWIGEELSSGSMSERIADLVAHGVEHGVQAVVVTNELLAGTVVAMNLGVPVLDASSYGS